MDKIRDKIVYFYNESFSLCKPLFKSSGLLVAFALILVIGIFLIPLPPYLLDIFLVLNIVLALSLLLRGVFLRDIRRFYTFPSILLFTTLFRLALNVSSTRLILTGGHESLSAAGDVIESFGNFVVQNNFMVGLIVFAVISIVNFLVIAKGSARVAEVSARFSLDALPGKQLAIDADLRSGNISSNEASNRRKEISNEAQFFGSMDGAMKFVQGDAVAGFIITFINIIGGLLVGVRAGMSFPEAFSTFGLLTIGDGLVGILPSLLISICAGIVVTNVSSREDESSSGEKIIHDLFDDPLAFFITGFVLVCLGLIPGLPIVPFLSIGILVLFLSFYLNTKSNGSSANQREVWQINSSNLRPREKRITEPSIFSSANYLSSNNSKMLTENINKPNDLIFESNTQSESNFKSYFKLQPLILEISPDIKEKIEFEEGNDIFKSFYQMYSFCSEKCFNEKGLILPLVKLRFNEELLSNNFSIFIREKKVFHGSFPEGSYFTSANESQLRMFALPSEKKEKHPIKGISSFWSNLNKTEIDSLKHLGIEVFNSTEYLALKVHSIAMNSSAELFGLKETQSLLDMYRETDEMLIHEVIDNEVLTLSEFSEILKRLVKEAVSIRDLRMILEGVLEFNSISSSEEREKRELWLDDLKDFLRSLLVKSSLISEFSNETEIRAFSLSAEIEEEFKSAISVWDNLRNRLPFSPEFDEELQFAAQQMFSPVFDRGLTPIIVLCSEDIRKGVQSYFKSKFPGESNLRAVSYEELETFKPALCIAELQF